MDTPDITFTCVTAPIASAEGRDVICAPGSDTVPLRIGVEVLKNFKDDELDPEAPSITVPILLTVMV